MEDWGARRPGFQGNVRAASSTTSAIASGRLSLEVVGAPFISW